MTNFEICDNLVTNILLELFRTYFIVTFLAFVLAHIGMIYIVLIPSFMLCEKLSSHFYLSDHWLLRYELMSCTNPS